MFENKRKKRLQILNKKLPIKLCIQQLGRVEEMIWLSYDAIRNI